MDASVAAPDEVPPISAEQPCGPDLDAEGDPDFLNFLAEIDAKLPATYSTFEPDKFDFQGATTAARNLLGRTLDVRLTVLLAKLSILNRDLPNFAYWLSVTVALLVRYWDEIHPRGEDGDFGARLAHIATLDDSPVVVQPLHYVALAESRREGALTFRAQLIAAGEATPRENEKVVDAGAIEKILNNAELPALRESLSLVQKAATALDQITKLTLEKLGPGEEVSFKASAPLLGRIAALLQAAVVRRDPSAAPVEAVEPGEDAATDSPPSAVQFATRADLDVALAKALNYFAAVEPSSAALLLVGQSRQLLGKNLYEIMKVLAPSYADAARVYVGAEPAFTIPVSSAPAQAADEQPLSSEAERAASRAEALALIESVAAHLRRTEPSSPIPSLLDRAKALASRDFHDLLREILPEDALSQMRRN
jgi:type VI secretion system protein ImpA